MYNERKDTFSVKDIIVQVLCILLFIFLLLWLFPTKSFIKKNTNSTYASDGSTVTVEGSEQIADTIFNFNVQTMKEAAISYYTTSRLPKKVGDKDTMSLRKMLNEKLLLSFLDSDNKQCDLDNSYVQITKLSDEYTLKVNLVCPASKSDYIVVHLGCYDYCKGNVCEKKVTPTPAPKTYKCKIVNGVYWGSNSTKVDKATYEKQCTKPVTYNCKIVNGVYWGSNNTKVDKTTYEKQCIKTPTPQVNITCSVVNGVYYDNKGNVTNQANYNNVCNTTTTKTTPTTPTPTAQINITCSVVNGVYYDNKGNVTNQANYNNVCNTIIINEPKYQCAYIDGQYWGKNYNKVDKATYEKECTKPVTYNCKEVNGVYWGSNNTIVDKATYEKQCKTIEYQYKKTETVSGSCYWTASTAYTVREKTGTQVLTDSPYCDTTNFDTNKISADKKTCTITMSAITDTKKECTATAKGNYIYNESLGLCVAEKYNDTNGGYVKATSGYYKDTGCEEKVYYDTVPSNTKTTTYTILNQTTDYSCSNPNCYTKKYQVKVCTKKYVPGTEAKCTTSGYKLINGHCYYTKTQTVTTINRCAKGETYNEKTNKCEITTASLCKSGYTKSKDGSTCEKTVDKYEDVTHYTASEYVCGASTTNTLEKWSLSANDKTLTDAGYKYTGVTRVK